MKLINLIGLGLFFLTFVAQGLEECSPDKKFVYGCEPIDPLYKITTKLDGTHGAIQFAYSQSPYPVGMPPSGKKMGCVFKKTYETQISHQGESTERSIAFAVLGSEIRVTNLLKVPLVIRITGEAEREPLKEGETAKFTLTSADEERSVTSPLTLWRAWEINPPGAKKKECERKSFSEKMKAQVVTLFARSLEPGLWETPLPPDPTTTPTLPTAIPTVTVEPKANQ